MQISNRTSLEINRLYNSGDTAQSVHGTSNIDVWLDQIESVAGRDKESFLKAHLNRILAIEYQDQGDFQEAYTLLKEAVPMLTQLQDIPRYYLVLAQLTSHVGIYETNANDASSYFNDAAEYYFSAMEQYQVMLDTASTNTDNPILSKTDIEDGFILCGLGLAALANFLGNKHEYLEIIRCLRDKYGQGRVIDSWRNLAVLAKEQQLQGQLAEAKQLYEDAISDSDSFWQDELGRFSKASEYRVKFLEENYDIYLDMVQLCLQLNEPATAIEYLEKITNKLVTERLFLSPKNRDVFWSDIHAAIASRNSACLIWFLPLEDRTLIFLASAQDNQGPQVVTVQDYNRMKLWQDIKILQQDKSDAIIEKSLVQNLPEVCARLYDILFVPIKEKLHDIKELIIVPYGGFRLLPLHALSYSRKDSKCYIVDDYTINYAPSALAFMQTIKPPQLSFLGRLQGYVAAFLKKLHIVDHKKMALVSFANPDKDLERSVFLSVSRSLQKYFYTHELTPVTPGRLQAAINEPGWLKKISCFHSTSHADESGLMLHDDQDITKSILFTKEDIARLDLQNISQVVLSACKTGKTSLSIIDHDVSLAAAFMAGGAKTVIASLWPVPTALTTKLTEKMYEFLTKEKLTKPEALRKAQLWLKNLSGQEKKDVMNFVRDFTATRLAAQQGPPKAVKVDENPLDPAHPYNWAGFYCTGADDTLL